MGKRELLAQAMERSGLGRLSAATVGRWKGLVVFNYHRIGDPSHSAFDHALWSASQEEFERQVRFLKRNFDVVGIADLDAVLRERPGRSVLITFDDGYRDNYELAFPVLKQQSAKAVFFITSGFLDDRPLAWWDEIAWMVRSSPRSELPADPALLPGSLPLSDSGSRNQAIKQLLLRFKSRPGDQASLFLRRLGEATESGRCPREIADGTWMNWEMVREMDRAEMDVGGHTVTHPVLANVSAESQRREIVTSKQRIEAELGRSISAFSYPVGQPDSFTQETKRLLEEAGYEWAFSFFGGFSPSAPEGSSTLDRYDLPRIPVTPHLSPALFRSIARMPQIFSRHQRFSRSRAEDASAGQVR